jgi:hypothetical protein
VAESVHLVLDEDYPVPCNFERLIGILIAARRNVERENRADLVISASGKATLSGLSTSQDEKTCPSHESKLPLRVLFVEILPKDSAGSTVIPPKAQ